MDNGDQSLPINLCEDAETEGFDSLAGQTWIYPTNYPVREYQFNIVQNALFKNTLVSLPTGLGKTFIAAVVMYNFYRWYPASKIVFMAPTRPLVKQQIDACYDIMGIPKESTVELTGTNMSTSRENLWDEKRVFFITPQILQNDLDKINNLAPRIKCLVFDEAHKARGNHAYCEVVRKMCRTNCYFRVLALSATPGSRLDDVMEVVQNLKISHLEFRTEESLDVVKYVYKRNLTTVVVPLDDKLQEVVNEYLKILEINTRTLMKYKVFQGSCGSLTKGKIYMTMRQYQQNRGGSTANYGEIMKCFNICITLYHAWELLVRHGLRNFTTFFDEHIDKPLLRGNIQLVQLVQDIKEYLGPPPIVEGLPNGECTEVSKDVKFGHPKYYKLRDILLSHFKESPSSRVITFFEYRDSVMEAYALLRQSTPSIRPRIFIGQKCGITQRIQSTVVKAFREGQCNTLLSTSIGEEGLDVGEVDLIICFDISNKSPIRMVQRMGRTGRKKEGSIIVLVTEGKEQQTLKDCLIHKSNVASHVLGSREITKYLVPNCPRLVPDGVVPKCEKIFITVKKEPTLKKNGSLKEMFRKASSSGPVYSSDLDMIDVGDRIPKAEFLFDNEHPLSGPIDVGRCKQIRKQRSFQETHIVKHSKDTEALVSLLQLADSKKFNIPMSQIGASQGGLNKNFKQTDIRNMLFKSTDIGTDFVVPSTQVFQKPTQVPAEEKSAYGSRELFDELLNYLTIQSLEDNQQCKLCPSQTCIERYTTCSRIVNSDVFNWIELDDSVFTSIKLDDLNVYEKNMDPTSSEFKFDETIDFDLVQTPQLKPEEEILESYHLEKSIVGELVDKSYNFQAPKTLSLLLDKFNKTIIDSESSEAVPLKEPLEKILTFFKLKKIRDLFSTDEDVRGVTAADSQETLVYFPNLFEDDSFANKEHNCEDTPKKQMSDNVSEDSGSPVLCSFNKNVTVRKKELTRRKINFNEAILVASSTPCEKDSKNNNTAETDDLELSSLCDLSLLGIKNVKDALAEKQISHVVETSVLEDSVKKTHVEKFTDILDNKEFEWIKPSTPVRKGNVSESAGGNKKVLHLEDISDIFDVSDFGLSRNSSRNGTMEKSLNSQSQATVTQLLSLLNKTDRTIEMNDSVSQKENRDDEIVEIVDQKSTRITVQSNTAPLVELTNANVQSVKSPEVQQIVSKKRKKDLDKDVSLHDLVTERLELLKEDFEEPTHQEKKSNKVLVHHNTSDDFATSFSPRRKSNTHTPTKPSLYITSSDCNNLETKLDESIRNLSHSMLARLIDSDDEFEIKPKDASLVKSKSHRNDGKVKCNSELRPKHSDTGWIKCRPNKMERNEADFAGPEVNKMRSRGSGREKEASPTIGMNRNKKKRMQRKVNKNDFIHDEAEISEDSNCVISDDEYDASSQDCYEGSFVVDSQSMHLDTQMHARYLQSVRSPASRGKFKVPIKEVYRNDVFSQTVVPENDTYLDDSFIVKGDEVEVNDEMSELELLEKKLEVERRERKRLKSDKGPSKRRRIITINSDSD